MSKWLLRLGTIAALCACLVVGLRVVRDRAIARLDTVPKVTMTTVTVDSSGRTTGKLSDQYIGLSFENSALDSGAFDDVGSVVPLLKNLGSSIMRIGGLSADYATASISADQLAGLARLAKATDWRVIYTENLGYFDSTTVTADAQEVSAGLGSSLLALACGNEPDHYHLGIRPRSYTENDFLSDEANCLSAIRAGAPKTAIEGPDLASSNWLANYARHEAGDVQWLGQHYYPLGCNTTTMAESREQLVSTLLSPGLAQFEARAFDQDAAAASSAHAHLLIDETNSACAGGVRGLSNTYATALWVIDYLLTGAEHGVYAMNFHGGLDTDCQGYSPLCQTKANVGTSSYTPEPIYYGMLFTHLLGLGDLVPVTVALQNRNENIAAFALKPQSGAGWRVMVENLSGQKTSVALRVSGDDPNTASALSLTGPGLFATSGVKIQGSTVAGDGSFTPGIADNIGCASGSCAVTLQPYSASLVSLG